MKKISIVFIFSVFVLASTVTFAGGIDSSYANVLGKTDNIGFPDTRSVRTDINIPSNVNGSVGQVDWRAFSPAQGQKVDFAFSGQSQAIIERTLGGRSTDILNKLNNRPGGTYNVTETVDPNVDFKFSPLAQTDINRVTGGNAADIANKINTPQNTFAEYSNNGDIVIKTQNIQKF